MNNQNTYHSQTAKLKEDFCPPEQAPDIKVWKTIKLGTGLKTAKDFRKALKKSGNYVKNSGDNILGTDKFQHILDNAHSGNIYDEIELCCATVKEFTGKDSAKFSEIKTVIQRVGKLCQPWMGPLLRINYPDQPKGERLRIAIEPIAALGGGLSMFSVVHDSGERWLGGSSGRPDSLWYGAIRFVFLLKRSA